MTLLVTLDHYTVRGRPSKSETMLTVVFWVILFFVAENTLLQTLNYFSPSLHPVFSPSLLNRRILSRHIGTDAFGCITVSYLGLQSSHYLSLFKKKFFSSSVKINPNYENRLWEYIPASQRILTIFLAYQFKNLYDSIIWSDGPEFIAHHILAGSAAWGGMYPGVGSVYGIFFMGVSEISTTVLVILANFDDDLGVKGLAEAFPGLRVVSAVGFVVAFIGCRIVAWPWVSWFLLKDIKNALANGDDKKAKERKVWLVGIGFILGSLTLLQFLWLGQIFVMGKQEIDKMLA
ncbi:hypothetical protein TrVE_jg12449 [Triparma verrucosa]|uniref:TLC domain-containing protein n=1 Tax=Triparma verrucosa TaxID=1606542 RepID=A0A9W7BGP4_9STRA|nr:hypothetical protein TrVE_jg12449 [Triparma verrucosa]